MPGADRIYTSVYHKYDMSDSPGDWCYSGDREAYMGRVSVTASGKVCRDWSGYEADPSVSAKVAGTFTVSDFADGVLPGNLCRSPRGLPRGGPWCYTSDDGEWELCDVHQCGMIMGIWGFFYV